MSRIKLSLASAVLSFAVLITVSMSASRLQAAWDESHCDAGDAQELADSVAAYNAADGERLCLHAIRFFEPAQFSLSDPLIFDRLPEGSAYGTALRACIDSGSYPEEGCAIHSDEDVVLDFSGYTQNGGDCPIRVSSGARIDFIRFKVIAPNPSRAFCTEGGEPIPLDDRTNEYAWIRRVTIVAAPSFPPTCTLSSFTTAPGRNRLGWNTTNANRLRLLKSGHEILSLGADDFGRIQAGALDVTTFLTSDYLLEASGNGGSCRSTVQVQGRVQSTRKIPWVLPRRI